MNESENGPESPSNATAPKKHYRMFIGLVGRDGGRIPTASVLEHLKRDLDAFTALEGIGYFSGESQPSLIVECAVDTETPLLELARGLCARFDQDSIGLVSGDRYRSVSAPRPRPRHSG